MTTNVVPTVPDAPTITGATVTGETTASVSFSAPASNGGSPITSYTILSSPGGITSTLSQAGGGTFNVTGLTGGTSYTFTVKATNSVGDSSPSSASSSITTTSSGPTLAFSGGAGGPFNYLNTLKAPYTMSKGGYMIQYSNGKVSNVFGELVPGWIKDIKNNNSARNITRAERKEGRKEEKAAAAAAAAAAAPAAAN
jgi:hypothetical protein